LFNFRFLYLANCLREAGRTEAGGIGAHWHHRWQIEAPAARLACRNPAGECRAAVRAHAPTPYRRLTFVIHNHFVFFDSVDRAFVHGKHQMSQPEYENRLGKINFIRQ
jgi:hypothetical protein